MSLSNEPQKVTPVVHDPIFSRGRRLPVSDPVAKPINSESGKMFKVATLCLSIAFFSSLIGNLWQYTTHNAKPDVKVAKLGKILEQQSQQGSTAYLVELPTSEKAVVYGVNGSNTLFYGDAYQADTQDVMYSALRGKATVAPGTQQTDATATANPATTATGVAASATADTVDPNNPYAEYGQNDLTPGQAIGQFKGKIPALFPILDALPGFKYDKSISTDNTIYIVYDPRCPYCHQVFEDTRKMDLKSKGVTIKWLPSTVLGDSEDATAQAIQGMRAKNMDEFAATLGKTGAKATNITDSERKGLNDIMAIFAQAHQTAFAGKSHGASVPATFFLDKRTGEPRFIYGISLPQIQKTIFGQ